VDLHRLGVDFWDVMSDLLSEAPTRHPGYLLHLLTWLPDDGAVMAVYADRPERADASDDVDQGPRRWLGWGGDRHLQAAIWDLLAAANTSKGKPPTYPRPQRLTKAKSTSPWQAQYEAIKARMKR
jgi:hypothetical protein